MASGFGLLQVRPVKGSRHLFLLFETRSLFDAISQHLNLRIEVDESETPMLERTGVIYSYMFCVEDLKSSC